MGVLRRGRPPRRARQRARGDHEADRYDPVFQRTFEEYARHRGFVIDPEPVREPTAKPHVERGLPCDRESFFRGESWRDGWSQLPQYSKWCELYARYGQLVDEYLTNCAA